jgi:hypothetical protein
MGKNQSKYVVKINKTFEFPACVIDRGELVHDIIDKLSDEIGETIRLKRPLFSENDISICLEPVIFLKPKGREYESGQVAMNRYPIDAISGDIAERLLCAKYKVKRLNYTDAPDLYQKKEKRGSNHPSFDYLNPDAVLEPYFEYDLKPEYEEEYGMVFNFIYDILREWK